MNALQIVEVLDTVTRMQADVITDLFTLLLQHITAEEADRLPCVEKLNRAAGLRADLDKARAGAVPADTINVQEGQSYE